jgi:hypothetical protein
MILEYLDKNKRCPWAKVAVKSSSGAGKGTLKRTKEMKLQFGIKG